MKAQILADFIVECTITDDKSEQNFDNGSEIKENHETKLDSIWILHVDGASNAQESGVGLILTNFEGTITEYALRFNFKASNNQAKYEALLAGLKIAKELDANHPKVFTDSQLVAGHVKGEYEARDLTMVKYLQKSKDLISTFEFFEISYIPRTENARADALSRLATTSSNLLGWTFIEYLEQPSINKVEKILQINEEPSWMDPIIKFLTDGTLPDNPPEAKRLRWSAS